MSVPPHLSRIAPRLLLALWLGAAALAQNPAPAAETPDLRQIVRRSVQLDHVNAQMRRQYTYRSREVEREVDKNGQARKVTISTYDHFFLYGHPYQRLVALDDKPLSPEDERKEEKKFREFSQKYQRESERDRQKRLAREAKQQQENRKFLLEIPDAYDFDLKGSEIVNGRDTWIIGLTPRPQYRARTRFGQVLKKIRATLWIDKADYEWARADAELIDTVSIAAFLVRLHKGARLQFERAKVNDEIWLPRWQRVEGSARVALFLNERGVSEEAFSDYRRYKADSKVTAVSEMPSQPRPPQ